jgi:hydrogenase/urease accessory protein HupE
MRKKLLTNSTIAAGALLTVASSALAHPGHSITEGGLVHAVTSPDHLAALVLTGVAFLVGAHFVQRASARWVVRGAGVAAISGACLLRALAN